MLDGILSQVKKGLFADKSDCYTVWNNSNWIRDSYVTIPDITHECSFTDEKGTILNCYVKDGKALVLVKDMKPFSFVTIRTVEAIEDHAITLLYSNQVSTKFYNVSWNNYGHLTSIYDKEADREILPVGKCGNVIQVFEDKPRCFDAWELEPTIDLKKEIIEECKEIHIEENALGIFVTFTWIYHKSEIKQIMCLYSEKKRIDFKTEVEWQERQKIMKVAFPINIRAVDARFDIQYGNISRPITRNNSWEVAKFEVVAHKWVDMWETGYGLALLNDCKYGHDVNEDTIRLTLLKSAVDPDYSADLGHHEFTYSILPHTTEWYESNIEQEAFDLNNPLIAVTGASICKSDSLFTFGNEHIVVDCMKQAENTGDTVIRFHEYVGARGVVPITSSIPIKSWCECDLMEQPMELFQEKPIQVTIKPYEIKTILVKFK